MAKPQIFKDIFAGIFWNVRNLNRSIKRRKSLTSTKAGKIEAKRRIIYGALFLTTLRSFGIPSIE